MDCTSPVDLYDDGYEFDAVPTTTANVSEAVRERVVRCMWQVPIMEIATANADSNLTEESQECSKKMLPLRMADSMVHKVKWLHELIYTMASQPVVYDELASVLAVHQWLPGGHAFRKAVPQNTHGMPHAGMYG